MPDVDKLFEKAEKYLQKQKFEAALETYLEILKYEPGDEEVLLNLGDLCLKLNRTADALRYLNLLAEYYVKRNEGPKAVVTYRKILKLTPQDAAVLLKLGGLLEKSQKNAEAVENYRAALEIFRKGGAMPKALECLERITRLDPGNIVAQVELGETAASARMPKTATPAFLKAAQLSREAGDEERWGVLVERAHMLDPADEAACIAVAENYAKNNRAADTVALLEPIYANKPDDIQILELLSGAYLATGNFEKAQPVCWKLYQAKPASLPQLLKLIEGLIQSGRLEKALAVLAQTKTTLFQQGKKNDYLQIAEKVYAADESNLSVLEMLSALYNEMNKEDGLRKSLVRLFNLYLASEDYNKAADTLERIVDVEPYGVGHYDRLLNLEGHIDKIWYENISSRIQPPSSAHASPGSPAGGGSAAAQKTEGLDDLILEGEMCFQYQLTAKLGTTLEKINRLYPGVEVKNDRLRELYQAAGFHPTGGPDPAAAPAATASTPPSPVAPQPPSPSVSALQSLDDLRKISELTANIYRESTPQGVMQVAINEIGRTLSASRCWGALGAPDRSPALMVEYCSPAATASDVQSALKLYTVLMRQAANKPDGWLIEDVTQFPTLASILPEVQKLGIKSLLALPLMDKDQPAGLILTEQCDQRRAWTPGEVVLLTTLATQVVIAVNNTKLRRLVRSLAGSEEDTGLLPRSSYLDCLLSEAGRAKQQSQPLSVCLVEPEDPTGLVRTLGDAGVQRYFQQITKVLQSNLRQNDIAIRYNPCAIAVVYPDTALPQGGLAVEKLRRAFAQVKPDGKTPPEFCGAVCDVQLGAVFDSVDGITEVINRLDRALEEAHKENGHRVHISKFEE
ncbi:MAG TPA: tetratricopeptide repeat protein [Terriglobia bacterium]|nr:tetratricopeptide repeat protein [Terriglobia bacterium]